MAGLRPVRRGLGAPVWPDRDAAYSLFGFGRRGHLCAGAVRKVLGTEWSRDVELKQGHKLVESGPYRFVRHPIYTGHLLMGLGTAVASGLLVAFVGLASFAAGFWIKLNQEERLLRRGFPDEYPAYKARVKALIPYVF